MTRTYTTALIAIAIAALGSGDAAAQTVSPGLYYATPSWDQKLQCDTQATCPRFVVLSNFGGHAVLDRETGLVWERSPLSPCTNPLFCVNIDEGTRDAFNATLRCSGTSIGGRMGWRLPSLPELQSLIDTNATSAPTLPAGHPFIGIQAAAYWSLTITSFDPNTFWAALFNGGLQTSLPNNKLFVWCVRGGPGLNPQ